MPYTEYEHLLNQSIAEYVIPSEHVAHVQPDNTLEHALLVLVKSGYTAIPVLNTSFELYGIISKAKILDATLGMERIEPERLDQFQVKDTMTTDFAVIHDSDTFERAISLSIDHPFICVKDSKNAFSGIVPRSKILARMNGYLHEQRRLSSDF
ncbi:cyclic-di-AMP-binding protein CbpB [Salisediminibacterium halotolerans]|uniref:CBS domain-containing protein n=1 Tax=Salisediminibacterium halotolerans TaxID=517425 RepID=A0A1H9PCI9_9BACI|nr:MULTISPECIES: cyclic-di-AMP-binding protein CbpB [Salisediminibacterium]RLJ78037.1 CBS domain protein [Actinophytocola xinjiangensis]RPE88625.1 CBS domain protein [Salisediminibacterium halotolerans]TWG37014.1 CBS domain protein [Salisediminibacterium halotolerans]SER45861.1 CBS domain-containing protein [Salisediminibacterium haloalkalitolerans]GEL08279.1 CBS domain-containing protein [Salisediminibacterium halotolerans]